MSMKLRNFLISRARIIYYGVAEQNTNIVAFFF